MSPSSHRPLLPECIGLCLVGWLLFATAAPTGLHAQGPPGWLGLGLYVGNPTGVTLKLHQRPTLAYTVLAAWDLDDAASLHIHGVAERPVDRSPLRLTAGPGLFTGLQGADWFMGVSGLLGTNFYQKRFEVLIQAVPRLRLVPDLRGAWGFGIGLRYFFEPRTPADTEN